MDNNNHNDNDNNDDEKNNNRKLWLEVNWKVKWKPFGNYNF